MKRAATAVFASVVLAGVAHAAEITIYKQPNFTGDAVTVRNESSDLGPLGITDQASSLVVRGGRWQLCTQPDFQGDCQVLGPGRYPTLDVALNHRVESVRELERTAGANDWRYGKRSDAYGEPAYDGRWRDERWREERRDEDRWRDREDNRDFGWSRDQR